MANKLATRKSSTNEEGRSTRSPPDRIQFVTQPTRGLDPLPRFAQLLPEPSNVGIHGPLATLILLSPCRIQQLTAAQNPSRVAQQADQKIVFGESQAEHPASGPGRAPLQIHRDSCRPDDVRRHGNPCCRAGRTAVRMMRGPLGGRSTLAPARRHPAECERSITPRGPIQRPSILAIALGRGPWFPSRGFRTAPGRGPGPGWMRTSNRAA